MVGGVPSGAFQPPLLTGSPAPVVSGGGVDVVSPVEVVSPPPPPVPPGKPGVRGPPGTGVSRVPEPDGAVRLLGSEQALRMSAVTSAAAMRRGAMETLLRPSRG